MFKNLCYWYKFSKLRFKSKEEFELTDEIRMTEEKVSKGEIFIKSVHRESWGKPVLSCEGFKNRGYIWLKNFLEPWMYVKR